MYVCMYIAQTTQQRQWNEQQANGQAGEQAMSGNKDYREESCISKSKYYTSFSSDNFATSKEYKQFTIVRHEDYIRQMQIVRSQIF